MKEISRHAALRAAPTVGPLEVRIHREWRLRRMGVSGPASGERGARAVRRVWRRLNQPHP